MSEPFMGPLMTLSDVILVLSWLHCVKKNTEGAVPVLKSLPMVFFLVVTC